MAERPNPRAGAHPTPGTYIRIATLLAILTALEVAVLYIEVLEPVFLPLFLILSLAKFGLVVLFYMHLKFDSRLFSGVFVGGLLLAIAVAITLMALFQVLSTTADRPDDVPPGPPDHGEPTVAPAATPTPTPAATVPPDGAPATTPAVPATSAPGPSGDGLALFMTAPDNVGPQALWCNTCHRIEGISDGLVGPDLTTIGADAATRKPGMSAAEYLVESIVDPEGFMCPQEVPRCGTPGLMTHAITENLTGEQVDALVEFLLQQK